jgi:hypothetical protein
LILKGVEPLFHLAEPLLHALAHLRQLPQVREDLSLPLGRLVEGLGCQADALGLMPKFFGRLSSGFVHSTLGFSHLPTFLGLLTLCFRALAAWLIPAHGALHSLRIAQCTSV